MADSSRPSVAGSSMIDLKAELFRKQEEYKHLKAQNAADFIKGRKSEKLNKKSFWSKQNAGVAERAGRDLEQKEEEDNVMERSRRALEAKSKIYDEIASASGIPDEDGSEGYLVDFQRKAVDRIVEERHGRNVSGTQPGNTSDDDEINDEPVPAPSDPGEEWVDYVDTFGRSRRCMKKDLPQLETQERPLGRPPGDSGLNLKEGATLLSADMKRELRRQQWEKETQENADGPVHYANVQFDEIRSHGTGFYQFSKDSNLREEQMEMLNKLREQTMDSRQRSERIKEKRKAALEARLAKVKQRRKMKGGSDMGTEEEEKAPEEETTQATSVKEEEGKKDPEPLMRDDSWRRSAPVREWDKGKEKMPEWSAKRYMDDRRKERESEFAPPQFYFDKQPDTKTPFAAGRTGVKNPAGSAPKSTGSLDNLNTNAMLKQIRNSVGGPSSQVPSGPVDGEVKYGAGESVNKAYSSLKTAPQVDPTAIPLPDEMATGVPPSSAAKKDTQGRENSTQPLQPILTTAQHPFQGQGQEYFQGQDQGYMRSQGYFQGQSQFQPPMQHNQMGDFSVPPPGWCQPGQSITQPAAAAAQQSTSTLPWPAESSVHAQQSTAASSFRYPSQQGLLSSQPQQTSISQCSVPPPAAKASTAKTSTTGEKGIRLNMVDKRFMQNREVSDEDLLGYMAGTAVDPLAKVEAVPYTPGSFTSAASSHKAAKAEVEHGDITKGESSSLLETRRSSDIHEAKTAGVIFGVPDFLQPASNVAAKTYQPGSFMAAKEAAAQRAEEEYEASRKKKQYSSAPVLYGRDDGYECEQQQVKDSVSTGSSGKEEMAGSEKDGMADELTKFLKEVRGGK